MNGGEREKATVRFLKENFKAYYKEYDVYLPERFRRREFGFMFFDADFVQRHLNFASPNEVRRFLVDRVPAHAYYSSAYYENPGAERMEAKEWLGADLIFDLDADHVDRVKGMAYEEMLKEVKKEVIGLVEDFLLRDFGFEERDLLLTFSGGRGYHVHVRDPSVWELSSPERREIVDYITGKGIESDSIFRRRPYDRTRFGMKYRVEMPSAKEAGWAGRISRDMISFTTYLESLPREEAIDVLLGFEGIGEKIAEKIHSALFQGKKGSRGVDRIRDSRLDFFSKDTYLNAFVRAVMEYSLKHSRRQTDEPVTSDTRRLIRLPRSLHGGTGMMVKVVSLDSLEDFDPLLEAFPERFSDEPVRIRMNEDFKISLKGETFNLEEGIAEVPVFAAIFLMCRRKGWIEEPKGN